MTYIAVSALSHDGLVRDHNEDSLVIGPWTLCATVTENPQTLLFPLGTPLVVAVADGLGGHPSGDLASALVVRKLSQAGPRLVTTDKVRAALDACNAAIYAAAARDERLTAMGSTVAGVVVTPDSMLTFNVGDSRVYAFDPDGLRQISTDDNPPLAEGERSTSVVTQTLGGHGESVDVDPHIVDSPLSVERRYLVCSDGLTDLVPDGRIEEVLREHEDGRAVFELWKVAMEAGGVDNVSIAYIRVEET